MIQTLISGCTHTLEDEILAKVLFGEMHRKHFGKINIGDLDETL